MQNVIDTLKNVMQYFSLQFQNEINTRKPDDKVETGAKVLAEFIRGVALSKKYEAKNRGTYTCSEVADELSSDKNLQLKIEISDTIVAREHIAPLVAEICYGAAYNLGLTRLKLVESPTDDTALAFLGALKEALFKKPPQP